MVLNEEQVAFSDWINQNLKTDKDVQHHLPLNVRLNSSIIINHLIPLSFLSIGKWK